MLVSIDLLEDQKKGSSFQPYEDKENCFLQMCIAGFEFAYIQG